jgi:hypothetical protein
MNVTLHIPESLAARLRAAGASPEQVALDALQRAADDLERGQPAASGLVQPRSPAAAAARIRLSRPGNVLPNGVSVRDLMTHWRG